MQAVVTLPSAADAGGPDGWERLVLRRVSGLPLLVRVLTTAARGGVTSVLIVRPADVPDRSLSATLGSRLIAGMPIQVISVDRPFDSADGSHWSLVAPRLEPTFLWLPWNYVTLKRTLGTTIASGKRDVSPAASGLTVPAVVVTDTLLTTHHGRLDRYLDDSAVSGGSSSGLPGIAVSSTDTRRAAERLLVDGSGKETDGIYSTFNRRLCRPGVRWLANTPVTANMVTFAGLGVTVLSGYWYAEGYWIAYVVGALLYFLSVLLDEVDGMIARTKFQDSAFGTWLETITDYASYLFLWIGMSVGLSRQYGTPIWLALGSLTLVMTVLVSLVLVRLRTLATSPDQPERFNQRIEGTLEADSANPISRGIRKIAFLAKKGVMAHYVVLFTVLGLLPLFVGLAAFGSVLALGIVLYTRRFFRAPAAVAAGTVA